LKALASTPNLVEQVRNAILDEVIAGKIGPGERIIQEQIAQALGVSRQPVQQALALLRNQGVLQDAPGRGLIVTPLDPEYAQQMYDVRAALEGLASRRAAEKNAALAAKQGPALLETGRKAVASGAVAKMIAADIRFHEFLYTLSGNELIAPALATHLTYTQRMMGEVLIRDAKPRDIWDQHADILAAVIRGDGATAEALTRSHIQQAASFMVGRIRESVEQLQPIVPTPSVC
jgi:DNA-binding GntR family transcriptional regulator